MRIVVVSPYLPRPDSDNAGGRYLALLDEALVGHEVTYLVPDLLRNRTASALDGAPAHVLVGLRPRRVPFRPLRHVLGLAGRLRPLRASPGLLRGIRLDARAVEALGGADVLDVQWEEYATLLPALRRLAPRARSVVTLHDVSSQRFDRLVRAATSGKRSVKWRSCRMQAKSIERRVCHDADAIVVFSDKDRSLLPREGKTTVVYPPLAADLPEAAGAAPARQAVFVGPLWRDENLEGLQWLARRVWPIVRDRLPDAELLVAGTVPEERGRELSATPGIRLLGFCEDLGPLYDGAGVIVAPLLRGAGVKFKVVDALARGIPVVGTSVAVEGIGDAVYAPTAFDAPADVANEIVRVLSDPAAARREVAAHREWARERYGRAQFERRIAGVYGRARPLSDDVAPAAVETSVVIPVRNGEAGVPDQLDALARQTEARQFEVVVSDNGSTDRTAEVVLNHRGCFADLRVVDSGDRAGVSHARNVGVVAARGRRIIIVDHDDEVRPGFVRAMEEALEGADLVGGRAVTGHINDSARALDDEHVPTLGTSLGYLPYALGGVLAVRRDVFLEVGGFDESFVGGHEEADFSWRLQRAGYRLAGAPGAILDYRQRSTARGALRQFRRFARSSMLLWVRYHDSASLGPVSFRGSVGELIRSVAKVPRLFDRERRFEAARSIGWMVGTVEGHLRYRVLGRPPEPRLLDHGLRATSADVVTATPR